MIGNQVTIQLFIKSLNLDLQQYYNNQKQPLLETIFQIGNKQSSSGQLQLCSTANHRVFQIRKSFISNVQKSVLLLNKNKASLKIYLILENSKKLSVGFVKVPIAQQSTGDAKSYKIQNCYDRKAYIEVSVGIKNKQIKQIQRINSPTSQSSLSQIRDLHRLITSPRQSLSGNDIRGRFPFNINSYNNVKLQKRRSSNKSGQKNKSKDKTLSQIHNSTKTLRPSLSVQSGSGKGNQQNHQKSFQIYQQAISQLRKENQRLRSILDIQQQSNQQLKQSLQETVKAYQARIKEMDQKIDILKTKLKQQQQKCQNMRLKMQSALLSSHIQKINDAIDHQGIKLNIRENSQASHRSNKKFERKPVMSTGNRTPRPSNKFSRSKNHQPNIIFDNTSQKNSQIKIIENNDAITLNQQNQIKQLQESNQRLYQQLRLHKTSKQSLVQKLRTKQLNQEILQHDNQQLQAQINSLNKKINEYKDILKQNQKANENIHLYQQYNTLKKKYNQLERRFNQSLRAINSFKNDALKARQQLIQKQSLIKEMMHSNNNHNINNKNISNSRALSSSSRASVYQQASYLNSNNSNKKIISKNNFNINYQKLQEIKVFDCLKETFKQRQQTLNQLKNYKERVYSETQIVSQLNLVKNNINRSYLAMTKNFFEKGKLMSYKVELNRIIDEGFSKILKKKQAQC